MLLALTVLALFVSGHPVSEVFYWTQAAGAYIPTLAFISAPLLCLVLAPRRSGWLDAFITACVVLAAMSVEIGAFFAVAWGAGALIVLWIGRAMAGAERRFRWSDLQFVVALSAGLSVVVMLATARFGTEAEIFDASIAHRSLPSVWWTIKTYPFEVLSVSLTEATWTGLSIGLVSKLALFALCAMIFARIAGSATLDMRLLVLAFGLAAIASGVFSMFAAFYQFGVNCCQRHEAMRSQLLVVALVAFAWLVAQHPLAARLRRFSLSWLAVASVVAVVGSAVYMPTALFADYSRYGRILQARAANWQSGQSASPEMRLDLSHRGEVIGGIYAPGGTFEGTENSSRPLTAMMAYFGKTKIIAE